MTNGYTWSISLHHKINIFSILFQIYYNFVLGISVRYTHQDVTYVTEMQIHAHNYYFMGNSSISSK